jgi:hypothetical protein
MGQLILVHFNPMGTVIFPRQIWTITRSGYQSHGLIGNDCQVGLCERRRKGKDVHSVQVSIYHEPDQN